MNPVILLVPRNLKCPLKYNDHTLEQKLNVICQHEKGVSAHKFSAQFSCGKTQIGNIICDKNSIIAKFYDGLNPKAKCLQPCQMPYKELDEKLFQWFSEVHNLNVNNDIKAVDAAKNIKLYTAVEWLSLALQGVSNFNIQWCYNKVSFKQLHSEPNAADIAAPDNEEGVTGEICLMFPLLTSINFKNDQLLQPQTICSVLGRATARQPNIRKIPQSSVYS